MDGLFFITLVFSIPFMGMTVHFIWQSRTTVADYLRETGQGPSGEISWFREQMASGWHFLVMGYVAMVWLLAIGRIGCTARKTIWPLSSVF